MSIKKQFIKTKPVCKVTFSVEAKEATSASVVGDFNNWDPKEGELSKLKNGTFKGVFDLPKESRAYCRKLFPNPKRQQYRHKLKCANER